MFYDKFAYLCKQKGVSVSRGALEAGISKSLVTKWKNNSIEIPSADVITKLAKYFNITVAELLDEDTKKAPAESGKRSENHDVLDDVDIAFYGDYKELTEDDKATVRDMVRIMRERRSKKQEQ